MRPIVEPVTADGSYGTITTHPAFGQVAVHRSQGRSVLYGSDFVHHSVITLSIQESQSNRDLSRDWFHATKHVTTIEMSEAQWATLVSSFNMGDGVPCTLTFREGVGHVPGLPDPKSREDQFAGEFAARLDKAIAKIDDVVKQVVASGLSKKKQDELVGGLRSARQEMVSNLPFVADSFGKHMETSVERAKVEIHGYASNLFQRAGVAALAGEGPIALPAPVVEGE